MSSCKKEELTFIIKGTISDNTFSGALQGADVRLYVYPLGSSLSEYKKNIITDNQGSYKFDLERDKYEKIELIINKDNYFKSNNTITFSNLTTEEDNVYNYSLTAKSWTKFIFLNQQPSSQDELKIFKDSGKSDCDGCCPDGYSYYLGAVDTSFYCANNGNEYMRFYYWVNGNEQNGLDSVYNEPFDTVVYEYTY